MDSIKIYIERNGKPKNFMINDLSEEASRRIQVDMKIQIKEEQERLKIIIEEGIEKELKKMKEKHIKDNLAAIKDDQNEQLDEKSKPIRQYLMDNLVPILTEGLIETCKLQPDDPVDSLAEFLFRRSLDVPYPDPCSYIE